MTMATKKTLMDVPTVLLIWDGYVQEHPAFVRSVIYFLKGCYLHFIALIGGDKTEDQRQPIEESSMDMFTLYLITILPSVVIVSIVLVVAILILRRSKGKVRSNKTEEAFSRSFLFDSISIPFPTEKIKSEQRDKLKKFQQASSKALVKC